MPHHTFDVNVNGLLNLITSILSLKAEKKIKLWHASTSDMFGLVSKSAEDKNIFIDETFPLTPMSPYAASKTSGYYCIQFYRKVYNMFLCTALSFNHEGPLRND